MPGPYRLGLPFWGFQDWLGNFYRRRSRPRDFLRQYASVFDTVEGNTTFYSLPSEDAVARWRAETPSSFRFCFKLPRTITHDASLVGADAEVTTFFARLAPLEERLGPFMIQLPAWFGPDRLDDLDRFLAALPRGDLRGNDWHFAVEFRHLDLWREPAALRADEVLARHGCDRVLMDTRALREGDPDDPDVAGALHKKPDLPVVPVALGPHPLLRWVGHPDSAVDQPWLEHWAQVVAGWIDDGREPYVMIHVPNNVHSPPLARTFHELLSAELTATSIAASNAEAPPELAPFPADEEPPEPRQLSLLDRLG